MMMKKYEAICERLRQEILQGYRKKDDPIPSIRSSVRYFRVSQTSVERAYAQLQLEGYIYSRPQRGYFVALSEENRALHEAMMKIPHRPTPVLIRYDFRSQSVLAEEGELAIWKQYLKEAMRDQTISSYGDAKGEYALRVALMRHALMYRGVLSQVDQIVVGASVQALLYQLCGMLPRNCRVAIQRGVFVQARRVFEDYGMHVIDIDFAEDGHFDLECLKEAAADLLFVHSPSLFELKGFDDQQRKEFFSYLKSRSILLLEDDHNGELCYLRDSSMALSAMGENTDTVYFGSFSRILLPSLRISYMILPRRFVRKYQKNKEMYSPSASKFEQLAFAGYISDGHLRRRIARLKRQYRIKHQILMEEADRYDLRLLKVEESLTRYYFYEPRADQGMADRIRQSGIALDRCSEQCLVLSFAALPMTELSKAFHELMLLRERK